MKKRLRFLFVLLMMLSLVGCGSKESNKKIDWEELEIEDVLPEIDKAKGEIQTNRSDLAVIDINGIERKDYKNYVKKCRDKGFTVDLEFEPWDTVYGAFNKEGYSIRIVFLDDEMSITVETPEKDTMKKIEWPSNGLGTMLPVPKSTLGKIINDSSDSFQIRMGDTSIDEYSKYVKSCEKKGYTKDYNKEDKSYEAKNSKGYELELRYLGANVVEISLKVPEDKTSSEIEPSKKPTEPKKEPSKSSSKLGGEFKKAMDDYEKFIDEYIAFMKKYEKSNGTDLSIMKDYAKYIDKYTKMVDSFDKWEDEELNTTEEKYYLQVQSRVAKKLLDASL